MNSTCGSQTVQEHKRVLFYNPLNCLPTFVLRSDGGGGVGAVLGALSSGEYGVLCFVFILLLFAMLVAWSCTLLALWWC